MSDILSPYEKVAGCYYLARLACKIRLEFVGQLSDEYRPYLFHRHGADTQFLRHFGLTQEEIVQAVRESGEDNAKLGSWFEQRANLDDAKRQAWNELAVNLGKEGYPMFKSLMWAKQNLLPQCSDPSIDTVFKAIEWDEGRLR